MPISLRKVRGSGPADAEIAFVGEGPGRDEDKSGRPFTGPSGRVAWAMAKDYARISRNDVYVTNLSKYRLTDDRGKDRPPTQAEAEEWSGTLEEEIAGVAPRLVVTLGRWSSWALTGRKYDMAVMNGMLYDGIGPYAVIPVTHPAAGMHQPQMLSMTSEGMKAVGRFLRGEPVASPRDTITSPRYLMSEGHFPRPCKEVGIDTEGPVARPWSLQYCTVEGVAWLIRGDDTAKLAAFRRWLEIERPVVILHHALHDLAALKAMGIDIVAMGLTIRDTMIELFLRQTDPQGLKAAALRLCGMEMREYEDVVGPVAESFAATYLRRALEEPAGEWGIGEGRKHSVVKRIEGLLKERKSEDARTIRAKWNDEDAFGAIRDAVEATHGPMPSPAIDDIPQEDFLPYACRDADAALRLARHLSPSIDDLHLRRVHEVDHRALPLIARMQEVGMLVDTAKLADLRGFVRDKLQELTAVIRALVEDDEFNPASGDHVAAYCVRKGLPMERMTKGGKRIQVDEDQLQLVRTLDDNIELFLTHREFAKANGTYIEPLPGYLVGTGRFRRLHPTFRTSAAITGRLAIGGDTSIPLMGIPTRGELGKRIRSIFVAGEGRRLGSCDLSQIELRVGAALSQDDAMMQAYIDGADIHTRTAAGVFRVANEADVDELLQRRPAKTMNFLIFFGGREHRLNGEFLRAGIKGYTLQDAKDLIGEWFALYPGVERWIRENNERGARDGYITTDAGRRRYVPGLRFQSTEYPFNRLREEAERQASNFPIQGTAQELEKRAMVRIDDGLAELRAAGIYAEPLLQIHDDVMVEYDADAEEVVREMMLDACTAESPWHGVPIRAAWKSGTDWASMH